MSRAICPKCGKTDVSWIRDDADCAQYVCLECKQSFWYPPKTVFDHIIESVETLAEKLVYFAYSDVARDHYKSTIVKGDWSTESKAIAATIKELQKEWKR